MKKFLALLLLVSCVCMICSCSVIDGIKNKFTGNNNGDEGEVTGVAAFTKAIEATNASNVIVEATTETALGQLSSTLEISFKADGSAVINYSMERFNEIGEGEVGEDKTTVTGTINRAADGSYSGDMISGIDLSSVSQGTAIDLSVVSSVAEINAAGDVLTVTVPAANTEAVFGSAFAKDVNLEISIQNGVVKFINMTFEGGSIEYTYD